MMMLLVCLKLVEEMMVMMWAFGRELLKP